MAIRNLNGEQPDCHHDDQESGRRLEGTVTYKFRLGSAEIEQDVETLEIRVIRAEARHAEVLLNHFSRRLDLRDADNRAILESIIAQPDIPDSPRSNVEPSGTEVSDRPVLVLTDEHISLLESMASSRESQPTIELPLPEPPDPDEAKPVPESGSRAHELSSRQTSFVEASTNHPTTRDATPQLCRHSSPDADAAPVTQRSIDPVPRRMRLRMRDQPEESAKQTTPNKTPTPSTSRLRLEGEANRAKDKPRYYPELKYELPDRSQVIIALTGRPCRQMQIHTDPNRTQGNEVGGLLMGYVVMEESSGSSMSYRVVVTDALPLPASSSSENRVRFDHDAWKFADKMCDEHFRPHGKRRLGWYHTHPTQGLFFSVHDRDVHQAFRLPFQFGLVISPDSMQAEVHYWADPRTRTETECTEQISLRGFQGRSSKTRDKAEYDARARRSSRRNSARSRRREKSRDGPTRRSRRPLTSSRPLRDQIEMLLVLVTILVVTACVFVTLWRLAEPAAPSRNRPNGSHPAEGGRTAPRGERSPIQNIPPKAGFP